MKAIVQDGYGAPERVLRLAETDPPPIRDDDVLVRVRATSVNTPDWIAVTGVPETVCLKGPCNTPSQA
jgi:NADPH:quinone reductase-like Zn-dependent oxidoreductase